MLNLLLLSILPVPVSVSEISQPKYKKQDICGKF